MSLRFSFLVTCSLLLVGRIDAQKLTGNIVEYFGKEKVQEISEGDVIHVFKEGLVLRQDRFFLNSNTTPKEPVFARYLGQQSSDISAGGIGLVGNNGDEIKWESIEVDTTNEFRDSRLRSGYLYLSYTSEIEKTVLLDASGHTKILVNGYPHEGDHYDFGWSLIPIKLRKGKNEFIFGGGRFSRMRARLLSPTSSVLLTSRDLTTPDILLEVNEDLRGAIRVINTSDRPFEGAKIVTAYQGLTRQINVPVVSQGNSRKVPFIIPPVKTDSNKVTLHVSLIDSKNKEISTVNLKVGVKSKYKHHKKTFKSGIDGSIQYYSVAPSLTQDEEKQAMFLSVHGAGVEAVNQANAYDQKAWGHLAAATNRRPYGFAWEDWGRIDALEVLEDAEKHFQTDKRKTYLTGHSMGGHGTWYLGVTYPDRFAAIAPAAGYPDLLGYRESFKKRLRNMSLEEIKQRGLSEEQVKNMLDEYNYEEPQDLKMDNMIKRAGNPSRTLELKRNYLHYGIYVLHGEEDTVVPTFIAREMRSVLGSYHNDFTYYEYPDGTHWYGDHSVDWPPIFDFFKFRTIDDQSEKNELEFYTASPGISSGSNFIHILQQEKPLEISSFTFSREDTAYIQTSNIRTFELDVKAMGQKPDTLWVDDQLLRVPDMATAIFQKKKNAWVLVKSISQEEKGPHRYGGFKDAFNNQFVLVYATGGSQKVNDWYYNRARFDAEKFYYRANGNVEIIADRDFKNSDYVDRNVILYGNSDNNKAWKKLLENAPFSVDNEKLIFGGIKLTGDNYGAYLIYPRSDSDKASVGVVTATGESGMHAAFANNYLVNGTTFPDVLIFNDKVLKEGIPAVEGAGFFGMDWGIETGDFAWRK